MNSKRSKEGREVGHVCMGFEKGGLIEKLDQIGAKDKMAHLYHQGCSAELCNEFGNHHFGLSTDLFLIQTDTQIIDRKKCDLCENRTYLCSHPRPPPALASPWSRH